MNVGKYVAISGYIGGDCGRDNMAKVWFRNLDRNPDFNPEKIVVLCSRGERPPVHCSITDFIVCNGDVGHIRDGNRKHLIEGWPIALMTGLLIAYNCECDAIWIEQDCLAFGPFVTQMYSEIREGVGLIMGNLSSQPCAQALMLIRHWFIPELIQGYLYKKIREKGLQGEQAWAQMEQEMTGKFQRYSFGVDRDRPFDMKAQVFYLQQISAEELTTLENAGLLTTP